MFKLTENPDDGEIITSKETEMTHVDNVRTVYHKITFSPLNILISVVLEVLGLIPGISNSIFIFGLNFLNFFEISLCHSIEL